MKKTIKDLNEIKGKKVIVRVDFNVPVKNNEVQDENRIVQSLPTLEFLKEQGAKIILLSHLGRVASEEDKTTKSLEVVAKKLEEISKWNVQFVAQTRGTEVEEAVNQMNDGDIIMLENTRFEDFVNNEQTKYESKNDPELGKYWASLADIFVNDAFGTAHRAHASNVGIASNIAESAIGFLIEKEVKYLGEAVENPQKPFVALLGGAKVSDKILLIEEFAKKADHIIIGGAMAYTFLRAKGLNTGISLVEEDKLELAKKLMEDLGDKLYFAEDHICHTSFEDKPGKLMVEIEDGYQGLDIGPKTVEKIENILATAKTVIWNGPFGVSEFENFKSGSEAIAKAVAKVTAGGGTTIIGGGDSAAMAIKMGMADQFTHISTGGGSSIEFLEGKPLPGIASIQEK